MHTDANAAIAIESESAGLVADRLERSDCCDVVLDVHLARGDWLEAIRAAKEHTRTKIPTLYYLWGKKYELEGNIDSAISAYEKAGVHIREVPRMLIQQKRRSELEAYVEETNSAELWSWWGHYCESISSIEEAYQAYEAAGDTLSTVKLYCSQNQMTKALELAFETSDRASRFYLARQFENLNQEDKAIDLYLQTGHASHAIRLALTYAKDDKLVDLAQHASNDEVCEMAKYFTSRERWTRAAMLYAKIGDYSRSVEACIRGQSLVALEELLHTLRLESDEASVEPVRAKIAEAFKTLGEHRKAISVLAEIGDVESAIELSESHGIIIDEFLAEELSAHTDRKEQEDRRRLLSLIAKACKHNSCFAVAAKKYSHAGDRVRAMKCLIRTGDVSKIITFAERSKSGDVYILAANFLKTLDWSENPKLVEKITTLYTKAGAMEQAAQFYEMRAQAEIDEFRDYEQGIQALQEAKKIRVQSSNNEDNHHVLRDLQKRMDHICRFLEARHTLQSNAETSLSICRSLVKELRHEQLDQACLRKGDVFSLLVEYYYLQGDHGKCAELIAEMEHVELSVELYVDKEILKAVGKIDRVEESGDEAVVETVESENSSMP